ncbi:MAG: LysM peptidoglycan-binding domain-containing protein [Xanthomonadales bacterium]|nr:LysM peptidoglycan-binding domain-containing protein [Xanthomonadales bacterium]
MFKKFLTVFAAFALTVCSLAAAVDLREDHPDTYTVQKGDTLWDIAARFLHEPWLWPEIWQANPQIENPHLIYPGDVISLAYLSGRPTLSVTKRSPEVRREALDPVPAVNLADIQAHLRKMHVLNEGEQDLPYVIGLEESRLRSTAGQLVYVRGADFAPGDEFVIVRPTVRYAVLPQPNTHFPRLRRDPWSAERGLEPETSGIEWAYFAASDNGFEVLGYEVVERAGGVITRGGDPATMLLDAESEDVRVGDLLMPKQARPFDLSFQPHAPRQIPDHLRILALTDRIKYGGPHDVIALSAGARDGIDNGTVFTIYRPGDTVVDKVKHKQALSQKLPSHKVNLPDEYVGHVMVFRTFDKVSYGLIVEGVRPARLEDKLKAPVRLNVF